MKYTKKIGEYVKFTLLVRCDPFPEKIYTFKLDFYKKNHQLVYFL